MKKIILLAGLLLSAAVSHAQIISLESNDADGNDIVIENNDVIVFSTKGTEDSKMHFSIQNISQNPINLKLKMTDLENGTVVPDGLVQFCFGVCLFTVAEGTSVPQNPVTGVTLAPNAIDNGGYLLNNYAGDNDTGITYSMAFIQVDDQGNQIGENLINFQYKYEPTAGVDDFTSLKNIGIIVNNTIVKNTLDINAASDATLQLFDINGKSVKTTQVVTGGQSIDMSALSTGVYIAKFTTSGNKTSQIRVVKN